MEKEFVDYKIALELKELGFDEPCLACYIDEEDKDILSFSFDSNDCYQEIGDNELKRNTQFKNSITAPTYSAAFRWFREKYNAVCEIIRKEDGNHSEFIGWVFINNRKIDVVSYWDSKTYEEAELACLVKLIQIVKEK
jgi:hypothetical protein